MNLLRLNPEARLPLSASTFVSHILPPILCHYSTAILVLLPRTQLIRVVLLPITLLVAFRAAVSLDIARNDPDYAFLNIDLMLLMLIIGVRSFEWTLQKEPFHRQHTLVLSKDSVRVIIDSAKSSLNALDLVCNLRGVGWDWSQRLYVPPDPRSTNSRTRYLVSTLSLSVWYTLTCGIIHSTVQSFAPDTIGTLSGGTIFDHSLPPLVRYSRSSIIATLTAFGLYTMMQCGYSSLAFLNILILGHNPAQWPPLFDEPWRATSLREMWGRRWHQLFRQSFSFVGSWFRVIGGRTGMVMGAFLASGVLHHIAVVALDSDAEAWPTFVSFGMMGAGIVLEHAFTRATGRRVGGWIGWAWTMAWMILWGNLMIDAWARAGMLGSSSFLDPFSLVKGLVQWAVEEFDGWLRTL